MDQIFESPNIPKSAIIIEWSPFSSSFSCVKKAWILQWRSLLWHFTWSKSYNFCSWRKNPDSPIFLKSTFNKVLCRKSNSSFSVTSGLTSCIKTSFGGVELVQEFSVETLVFYKPFNQNPDSLNSKRWYFYWIISVIGYRTRVSP